MRGSARCAWSVIHSVGLRRLHPPRAHREAGSACTRCAASRPPSTASAEAPQSTTMRAGQRPRRSDRLEDALRRVRVQTPIELDGVSISHARDEVADDAHPSSAIGSGSVVLVPNVVGHE